MILMMCQCSLSITALVGDVGNEGNYECVRSRGRWESLYLLLNFAVNLKTVLKKIKFQYTKQQKTALMIHLLFKKLFHLRESKHRGGAEKEGEKES